MIINQTVESENSFGKAASEFLKIYSNIFATYVGSMYFLLYAVAIFGGKVVHAPIQSKIIFWTIGILFFIISYIIHASQTTKNKLLSIYILLGNAFGFLFNIIYSLVVIGSTYNYPLNLFGMEKCIIFFIESDEINVVEGMYIFSAAVLLFLVAFFVITYGLQIRDKIRKEGGGIKMIIPVLVSIVVIFFGFLSVLFYLEVTKFIVYSMTGSMLFIYGSNLFKKESRFLKF